MSGQLSFQGFDFLPSESRPEILIPNAEPSHLLPSLSSVPEIGRRLRKAFAGVRGEGQASGIIAARTVYAMMFIDAVDERYWLKPSHAMRLTDSIATCDATDECRISFRENPPSDLPGRWYSENSREQMRDGLIRGLFSPLGVVKIRQGIAQNSHHGRYCLSGHFAQLFDPGVVDGELDEMIAQWRSEYLSAETRAMIALADKTKEASKEKTVVQFPDGRGRTLPAGPGPVLCKAIVESFAVEKLVDPAVVALTEGAKKFHPEDVDMLKRISIEIDASVLLPDVILTDSGNGFKIVFVEAAATGGPMTEARMRDLTAICEKAGYRRESLMFVTAFEDRGHRIFKKEVAALPAGSHAWFASEPSLLLSFAT